MSTNPKAVTRVRHALKIRPVSVQRVQALGKHGVSITLEGSSLADFVSASFDDHVKLMLPPAPGAALNLPTLGENGVIPPVEGVPAIMRDYTPRAFDGKSVVIEMSLHGTGPAASWARSVAVGDRAGIGGPRGSMIVPLDFSEHVLIGDTTALPAIARRLEELLKQARARVLIAIDDPSEERELETQAALETTWIAPNALVDAVASLERPGHDAFAWAAGESETMKVVRRTLIEHHGMPRDRVRVSAYWKRGAADHHATLDD